MSVLPAMGTCLPGFVFRFGRRDLKSSMKRVLKTWYVDCADTSKGLLQQLSCSLHEPKIGLLTIFIMQHACMT